MFRRTILLIAVILSVSAFLTFSCKKSQTSPDLIGKWSGTVLIVGVEFTFTADTYTQRTTSFNDIMIGGTKGTISTKGNTIYVHQTDKYYFDNNTNTGAWKAEETDYTIEYKIAGDQITLKPSTSSDSMVLSRE